MSDKSDQAKEFCGRLRMREDRARGGLQLCSDAELFLIGSGGKQEQKDRQFKELSERQERKSSAQRCWPLSGGQQLRSVAPTQEDKPVQHERGRIQSHPPKPG